MPASFHFRFLFLAAALLPFLAARAQSGWSVSRAHIPNLSIGLINGLAYGKGRFVMAVSGGPSGSGTVWSPDAQIWQGFTPLASSGGSLHFIGDHFYTVATGSVYRSTDSTDWQRIHVADPGVFYSLSATDGTGMLLGTTNPDGRLVFSPDLVTWRTTAPLPSAAPPGSRLNIGHVAHGAGRYFVSYTVITGTPPANTIAAGYTASTVDGTSWAPVPQLEFVSGMAGGNGRLVAVAGPNVFVSTDGVTFTSTRAPDTVINPAKLLFGGGRFFVSRSLVSSVDGITWSHLGPINKTTSSAIWAVAYGKGRYVAGGFDLPPPGGTFGIDVLASIDAAGPPVLAQAPASRTVVEGQPVQFAVILENPDTATTFQWRRDGVAIPGAVHASHAIAAATFAHAGRFTVEIRNALGTVTSAPADLTVVPFREAGRLINLSVIATLDTPDATLTIGFVVGGSGTAGAKPLLVRAGGPSLARFGVESPNPDPRLELFSPAGKIGENDQWSGTPALTLLSQAVGAFPFLSADSRDAALAATVAPGDTTARIASNNTTGAVIAEVYDATPVGEITPATPRLINVSVLKPLAAHATLGAGFVIGGRTPKTVLIRAIGPSLARFGVSDPLANPWLSVFRTNTPAPLATNDDWAGQPNILAAMSAVGAFEIPGVSKDAALLLTLEPGNYVAQATSDATGGSVLVEIYDVP